MLVSTILGWGCKKGAKTDCPGAWRQTLPRWPGNHSALLPNQVGELGDIFQKLKLSSAKSCLDTGISSWGRNGPKKLTSVGCWSGKEEHGKEWWGKGSSSHFTQHTEVMSLLFYWLTASVFWSSSHSFQSQMLFPIYIRPLKKWANQEVATALPAGLSHFSGFLFSHALP